MSNLVRFTPQYYPLPTIGRPVPVGSKIYVGEPDTDPTVEANQKQVSVLQEDTTLVAVSQPILTGAGGVPLHNGSPVSLFVEGDYASRVDDPNDAQIYYIPRTESQASTSNVPPTWEVGTTYAKNADVIGSDSRRYYSIAGANLGKDPTSTSGFWQGFVEEGDDFVGDVTGNLTGNVTGNVTGDLTGDSAGTHTGDVVGNVTGFVTPPGVLTFTADDTTPSVAGFNAFIFAASSITSITTFDDGVEGQKIAIAVTGDPTKCRFINGATLKLLGGADITTLSGRDTISFVLAGGVWYETSRSVN